MKIWIIGTTGSGKSSLAAALAQKLGVPHLELDSAYWGPGWTIRDNEQFRDRVRAVIAEESWVVDGNYGNAVDLISASADILIWLKLPLRRSFPRLLRRTLSRIATGKLLWGENRETIGKVFFERDGILYYAIKTHRKNMKKYGGFWEAFPKVKMQFDGTVPVDELAQQILNEYGAQGRKTDLDLVSEPS